ncbi:hypothetical protein A0H81_10994 [Grifola frondosa]|uniref:Uncharacterized protein n=1 Tax=Grifola frondosa TaxID=5627 RepID=A0A1C7LVS5_GRIFR|nr:hypothetical protein A0H81_10994 [Grifola frondosa]
MALLQVLVVCSEQQALFAEPLDGICVFCDLHLEKPNLLLRLLYDVIEARLLPCLLGMGLLGCQRPEMPSLGLQLSFKLVDIPAKTSLGLNQASQDHEELTPFMPARAFSPIRSA